MPEYNSALLRTSLLLFALALPLAAAPAPFPRTSNPSPPTEVVVEAVGGLDRIELTFGKKRVTIEADGDWPQTLAACLKRFRDSHPPPYRLILRLHSDDLTPSQYIQLKRTCKIAGYAEHRSEDLSGR